MGELKTATCPVDGCRGEIRLRADLPEGVYDCICRSSQLRLRWHTTASFAREPHLSVATGEDSTDG